MKELSYKVQLRAPSELAARDDNPRIHDKRQLQAIQASISRFGMTHPILIDENDRIVAGHGRVKAALTLGLGTIPTICLQHLNKAELKAFMIADNRTAELASWDRQLLAENFAAIELLDEQFDLSATGFDAEEIDLLADYRNTKKPKREAEVPTPGQPRFPAFTGSGVTIDRSGWTFKSNVEQRRFNVGVTERSPRDRRLSAEAPRARDARHDCG